jgi:hypothetical protein
VAVSAFGQWNPQRSNTIASLHGLSIVNANIVWASGTGGRFVRTTDGGETWQAGTVPGGEKLDFRGVYAVDAKTAYLMSIGNGNESRIYKTIDTGKTWSLQYSEQNPKSVPRLHGLLECNARHRMRAKFPFFLSSRNTSRCMSQKPANFAVFGRRHRFRP